MNSTQESSAWKINGFGVLPILLLFLAISSWYLFPFVLLEKTLAGPQLWLGSGLLTMAGLVAAGFFLVDPNQARVLILLGKYIGSIREPGFYWTIPFIVSKRPVSLRVRNFNSEKLKVNDAQGSPIEIAAVVVWRVVNSAKATLDVESCRDFVAIQSETALRSLASRYAYDIFDNTHESLRGNPDQISDLLKQEVQRRLEVAGVDIIEARITHLAYAPEIAQAMLRRQQAIAVIAAKERIVEGALGMVEMALHRLSEQQVVDLDEERKAAMVNNLLVALVSESSTQPIINAGTLYT
ncbi:SPFH domain-containing protein [Acaryochloris sp. 'Moss Beach']|uniref:SPFH domain-containing protein n=1 Tax=Acaryochloris TaxID=155977 RepID=UPI001F3EE36F|nr:SPFH domain-containing protein [Acaryochloris sp. 'Moss Beach']UJB69416.1 SPFH domain-containing protein [Acaryochloris sp. 'Moss Beach']